VKKLIIFILMTIMISCATTQTANKKPDPYIHITVDNVKRNKCQPSENWNVGIMGIPAIVLLFEDCLKIKLLLVIATDNENVTENIRRSSIDLISLHYMEYLKRSNESKETKKIWSIKKVKEESDDGWLTYFFKLTYKTIKSSESECKEAK